MREDPDPLNKSWSGPSPRGSDESALSTALIRAGQSGPTPGRGEILLGLALSMILFLLPGLYLVWECSHARINPLLLILAAALIFTGIGLGRWICRRP